MKRLSLLFLITLFTCANSSIFAQANYTGAKAPDGYKTHTQKDPGFSVCYPGAIPEGEAEILDGEMDVTNGGCNFPSNNYTNINLGEVFCGHINGYIFGIDPWRDTDWYKLVLATPQTVFWTANLNFNGYLFILPEGCPALTTIAGGPVGPGVGGVSVPLAAGTYYFWISSADYGPGVGGDYMVKVSTTDPGPPATWVSGPAAVPTLSEWGLIILGLSMLGFGAFYIRRLKTA